MLTKRIPETLVQRSSSLQNCSLVLRAVWQRNYDKIYKLLRELPWPDQLKPLVQRYEGKQSLPLLLDHTTTDAFPSASAKQDH